MTKFYGYWKKTPKEHTPEWIQEIDGMSFHNGDMDFYQAQKTVFKSDAYFLADTDGLIVSAADDVSKIVPPGAIYGMSGKSGAEMLTEFTKLNHDQDPNKRLVIVDGEVRAYQPSPAEVKVIDVKLVDAELLRRQIAAVKTVNPNTPIMDADGIIKLRMKTSEDVLALFIKGDAASAGEKRFMQKMQSVKQVFDAFDKAADALRAFDVIPADHADDKYWVGV